MNIHYIAQSGFIITHQNTTIAIDLWINNPVAPIAFADVPKVDHCFLTHDHDDHGPGTMIALANRDHATLHCVYDFADHASSQGVEYIERANIGGTYQSGDVFVALTPALHTANTGVPVGFIIKFKDGATVYHTGDTGYISEFKMIQDVYQPDIVMLPIGGRYTMGPAEALYALNDLKPKHLIPMHYNTFGKIAQNEEEFKKSAEEKNPNMQVLLMKPGEKRDIEL
jgi:L-ascorbate metabolism protein UlaG (beta-lactamase superfamily)